MLPIAPGSLPPWPASTHMMISCLGFTSGADVVVSSGAVVAVTGATVVMGAVVVVTGVAVVSGGGAKVEGDGEVDGDERDGISATSMMSANDISSVQEVSIRMIASKAIAANGAILNFFSKKPILPPCISQIIILKKILSYYGEIFKSFYKKGKN